MAFFGITVNFSLQIFKSKNLICLSFWDISRDSRAKIYLSMEKMWAIVKVNLQKSIEFPLHWHRYVTVIGTYYFLSGTIFFEVLWVCTIYMVYLLLSGSKGFIFRDSLIVECFLISSKAAGSKKIKPKSLAQKKTHKLEQTCIELYSAVHVVLFRYYLHFIQMYVDKIWIIWVFKKSR